MSHANLHSRAVAALQSLYVGDALSMPVHWFYDRRDIAKAFPGGVKEMQAAPAHHPSSIMRLHSTSKGGRGSQASVPEKQIVGEVILRGKAKFWGVENQHYHQGMPAGENTLNAYCARLMTRGLAANNGNYDSARFLDEYIRFMTQDPPAHPDTYAESFHRGFFANLTAGKKANQCAAKTHDTPSVGGLVMIAPLAISQLVRELPLMGVQATCREHLDLTHPDETLARVCDAYVELLYKLLFRSEEQALEPLLIEASHCIKGVGLAKILRGSAADASIVGGTFSTACYITDSWPSLLYLAARYPNDVARALIANTNLGGENAHRGSVLGTIVGAAKGQGATNLFSQLLHAEEIDREIEALLA